MYTIAVLFYILIIFWTWKSLNFAYFRLSLELVRSYIVTFNFKHGNFVIFFTLLELVRTYIEGDF